MKTNYNSIISILVMTIALGSCGKSTKGKMANDWKVTSMTTESTSTSADGSKYTSTQTMNETRMDAKYVTTAADGSVTTVTDDARVNTNEFTIEKDGAWKWIQDLSYSTDSGEVRTRSEKSGVWSFIGKNKGDDFKKNERVLFNILKADYSTVHKNQGTIVNEYNANYEYLTGYETAIYTVKESKKDELQLEAESENMTNQYSNESKITSKTSMTLKTK
ncbi:hypothetical protein [Fluviicola sp.]|uniref:hypothetical protein n=1 Tax=Fluviicola sp. TaxID=1917219 RepID=UPI00261844E3|nr:hypothetical protein [Fluviicola sp.]